MLGNRYRPKVRSPPLLPLNFNGSRVYHSLISVELKIIKKSVKISDKTLFYRRNIRENGSKWEDVVAGEKCLKCDSGHLVSPSIRTLPWNDFECKCGAIYELKSTTCYSMKGKIQLDCGNPANLKQPVNLLVNRVMDGEAKLYYYRSKISHKDIMSEIDRWILTIDENKLKEWIEYYYKNLKGKYYKNVDDE